MRRKGDVMWRNFGWTAILATWTIFLILNSGLAGERILGKLQNNDDTRYKIRHAVTYSAFDKEVVDDSKLRYTRENFKSNDRLSMHMKAISLKFKNTENRNSQFSGYEKHIAMSNAMAPKYLKDSDDKSAQLIRKRTDNAWLSKFIVTRRSNNTRNNLKVVFGLRPSQPTSQKLKNSLRKGKRIERTIYVSSNGHKKVGTIIRDTQAYDKKSRRWKKHKKDRIFSEENGMTAFFPDKFTKNSRNEKDSSAQELKNSDISHLKITKDIESEQDGETHERNRNERNSRRNLKLTKNNANKLIYGEINAELQKIKPTFSNDSSSKRNQNRGNKTIITTTDNTITKNLPYQRSVTVTWTTLILNSKISSANEKVSEKENILSPYHSSESYKVDKFLPAKTYKRDEYFKIGFKVSSDAHEDKKEKDKIDSRASNSLNNQLARKRVAFTKRPFLGKKKNALQVNDVFDPRHRYHSSINRKTAKLSEMHVKKKPEEKKITAAANRRRNTLEMELDLLPTNLSTERTGESNLDYQMLPRISVTQKRNPMHVQHVGSDADCELPRRTEFETEVRDALRIGLWNVSSPSRIAKFHGRKPHGRPKYSQKFRAINTDTQLPRIAGTTNGRPELDEESQRISAKSISIFFSAANVSDNSSGMRKINGRVQSSRQLTDKPGLKNVRVTTRPSENHRDVHEKSEFYSQSDGVHNSKYRRYKRHENQNTQGISTTTEFNNETLKTLDTATTTSKLLIEFTMDPSISTTQTNNEETSSSAKNGVTSVETMASLKHKEFQKDWQSIPLTSDHDESYTNAPMRNASDSLQIPLINASKVLNDSSVATNGLIQVRDQLSAITEMNNSIIPKYVSSAANENVFQGFSTQLINSQERHEGYGNESVSTIDPFPQRNRDLSRDVFESITTENIIDSSTSDVLSDQWPVKHSAVVEGDLVLGGLMMVHEREDRITCGRVMPQGGIQALEAMLYTLDTLNDRQIVPGVKIGAHILDDCDKDTYGLEMAVDFIKGNVRYTVGIETTMILQVYKISGEISDKIRRIMLAKSPPHNFSEMDLY